MPCDTAAASAASMPPGLSPEAKAFWTNADLRALAEEVCDFTHALQLMLDGAESFGILEQGSYANGLSTVARHASTAAQRLHDSLVILAEGQSQ